MIAVNWLDVLTACANIEGYTTILLNKYRVQGTYKTTSEWWGCNIILEISVVRYFLLKKLREHRKRRKKSMGFLWFASVNHDLVDMKTAPALQASVVLLSCEEQTISNLFTELHFGSAPGLSSLMWYLTLHYPLQEITQSIWILCLLMGKMMKKQKRSGPTVCY